MRILPFLPVLLLAAVVVATPARAQEKIAFFEDPVFKPLNKDDEHPMADLILLADKGDTRAQFILGDLYAKGKGGLVKSAQKARHWFNQSAINGYGPSLIRLAALAKRDGNMIEAYSWYDLASALASGKDARYAATARDALNLSDEDQDKADALSTAWRKEKSAALKTQSEAAKTKKDIDKTIERAKNAAAENSKKSAPKKDSATEKPQTPAVKETRYND